MGYNRGGKNRTERLKRRKKQETRLARKAAAQTTKPADSASQVK